MTDTGIIRKLDALGRIVFLKSCATLSAGKPAQNADYTEGQKVIITKYEPSCIFCGEPTEKHIKEYRICPSCAAKCVSKLQAIAEAGRLRRETYAVSFTRYKAQPVQAGRRKDRKPAVVRAAQR